MITQAQKAKAVEVAGLGRGGLFLDISQRQKLAELCAKHYDKALIRGAPFTKEQIVAKVRNDPEIKTFLPFILLTVFGAIISWVIGRILDSWWGSS